MFFIPFLKWQSFGATRFSDIPIDDIPRIVPWVLVDHYIPMGIRNSFQLRFWTWAISGARGLEIHRGARPGATNGVSQQIHHTITR